MPDVVMTKAKRDEIVEALIANEQSRQLTNAVEGLRGAGEYDFAARSLVGYADSLSADVRDRVRRIIREHPEGHAAILSLLRTVLGWLDKDRVELKRELENNADPEARQKLRDIDHFEKFVRDMARDILRTTSSQPETSAKRAR